ncbi:MAG: MoxR family ATPase [Chloroflexota bacterium]
MRMTSSRAAAPGLLDGLGLIGMGEIEPVVIAAVASELPMLLVGPHGTGKSLLLTRIAEALGHEWRHYNASLLSYDDLVGYPVPDGRGGLDWLRTPATIWDAEAVFLDEINRCRPDLQNKLFPIIHERRVQGIALERLRFRWSAMNPAPGDDEDEDAGGDRYAGAEPLDAALADRFPFVVPMPDWRGLSASDQDRLLLADLTPVAEEAVARFRTAVDEARARYEASLAAPDADIAVYVRTVLRNLDEAGVRCSARRGAALVRTILAVRATGIVTRDDAALVALRNGLPQRASGGTVAEHKVVAAHREALLASKAAPGDALAKLLAIRDRFDRTVAALESPGLDPAVRSSVVADGWTDLPDGQREAVALFAFEDGRADGLLGAVASQLAAAYAMVTTPQGVHEVVATRSPRHDGWSAISTKLAGMEPGPETALLENLLVGLWGAKRIGRNEDVALVIRAWKAARTKLARRQVKGKAA